MKTPSNKGTKPVRFTIPLDASVDQLQKFINELKKAAHAGEIPPDPRSKWFHPGNPESQPPLQDGSDKEGKNGNPA